MALFGVDVSQWQGMVNWDAVASAGVSCAFAKVTEGNGFEDPQWVHNAGPLAAPGPITAGAYHFARPDLGNTPEAEADWFWSRLTAHVSNLEGWLLALDLEAGSGDLSAWRDRWCARIEAHSGGYKPGWYTYWDFAQTRGLNKATDYWCWLAWPDSNGPLPNSAFAVAFQQYGTTSVPGIAGQVDANRFFGDVHQLGMLTVGGAMAVGLDPNDPIVAEILNHTRQAHSVVARGIYWVDGATDPVPEPWIIRNGFAGLKDLRDLIVAIKPNAVAVDVDALASALAPHITVVDETKLAADLMAALPPADADAVLAALKKALSG